MASGMCSHLPLPMKDIPPPVQAIVHEEVPRNAIHVLVEFEDGQLWNFNNIPVDSRVERLVAEMAIRLESPCGRDLEAGDLVFRCGGAVMDTNMTWEQYNMRPGSMAFVGCSFRSTQPS